MKYFLLILCLIGLSACARDGQVNSTVNAQSAPSNIDGTYRSFDSKYLIKVSGNTLEYQGNGGIHYRLESYTCYLGTKKETCQTRVDANCSWTADASSLYGSVNLKPLIISHQASECIVNLSPVKALIQWDANGCMNLSIGGPVITMCK